MDWWRTVRTFFTGTRHRAESASGSNPRKTSSQPYSLNFVAVWVLVASLASAAGWLLSGLHQLNSFGYLVLGLVCGGCLWLLGKREGIRFSPAPFRWRRFQRLLPALWLGLALLILIGGALHAPNNYDYLTYRFPRVLHWAWEQQWHWIETANDRMNYSAPLFEWLMAPLFIFFKTDRLFFLINFISFLLLPGLIFWVFRLLGVNRRAAWFCMWLLPSGYCYAIQAGSAGNDSFAAVFLLASIGFALRARRSHSFYDLGFSVLAAALLTGAKASNLPLLLPCCLALWPSWNVFLSKPLATLVILFLALWGSFVPMGGINQYFTGHWSGDPDNSGRMQLSDPVAGLIGNSLQIGLGAMAPPVFPMSGWWNAHVWQGMPSSARHYLQDQFPRLNLGLGELPVEEAAGLGIGITGVLVVLTLKRFCKKMVSPKSGCGLVERLIVVAGGLALVVYMLKMGSECGARIVAPYYPLVLAGLFLVLRLSIPRGHFRYVAALALLSTYPLVILTPARTLVPVSMLVSGLKEVGWEHPLLDRAAQVYEVYQNRADALGPVRDLIPEHVREIGFIQSGDDSEVALWKPWGTRRVVTWEPGSELEWVAVSARAMKYRLNQTVEEWAQNNGYQMIARVGVSSKVQEGSVEWVLLKRFQVDL
jgi:hypothetical protein